MAYYKKKKQIIKVNINGRIMVSSFIFMNFDFILSPVLFRLILLFIDDSTQTTQFLPSSPRMTTANVKKTIPNVKRVIGK